MYSSLILLTVIAVSLHPSECKVTRQSKTSDEEVEETQRDSNFCRIKEGPNLLKKVCDFCKMYDKASDCCEDPDGLRECVNFIDFDGGYGSFFLASWLSPETVGPPAQSS